MRWLCILLLVANVAYFGWELNLRLYAPPDHQVAVPPPLPANVAKLKLLSELAHLPPMRDVVAVPSSAGGAASQTPASAQTTETAAAAETAPPGESNAVSETVPSASSTAASAAVAGTAASPPTSGSKSEEKPDASPRATNVPEKTGSPKTGNADTGQAAAGAAAEAAVSSSPAPERCLRVGPFDNETQVGAVRDRFSTLADRVAIAKTTRQERKFYWVYIEPVTSVVKAKATVEDLKSKGIKDLFRIRKGEMKNAISLGVFRSQASVRKRLAELKNNGYRPLVVPRYETKTEYWLDLRGGSEKLSKKALAAALPKGAGITESDCSAAGDSGVGKPAP